MHYGQSGVLEKAVLVLCALALAEHERAEWEPQGLRLARAGGTVLTAACSHQATTLGVVVVRCPASSEVHADKSTAFAGPFKGKSNWFFARQSQSVLWVRGLGLAS